VPKFRYTAIDPVGKRLNGVVEAANAAAVADWMHRQSYFLLRTEDASKHNRLLAIFDGAPKFRRGLSKSQIAHITRELSVMLEAGQDIDHALRFLVETSNNLRTTRVLQALRDQVRGGKSLAASLAEHPRLFSRLYVSLVRAGEAGGTLAESLGHLADLLERESRLTATIQSAMTYPILLLIASLGTIVMLLTYVLPQFMPIFSQAGAKLPFAPRLLIAAGDFVRNDGAIVLTAILALILAAYRTSRDAHVRMAWEHVALRIPIVGTLIRRAEGARLMRTLGTLLRNGVGLVPALGIARDVLGSLTAEKLVERAMTEVKSGARLATALSSADFFPVQTIHLVQLGEETAKLAEMALRAANVHEEQVQDTITRMVSLLVPVITIVMGIVVAGIVGSLVVAMLSLNDLAL
jgi:general secretion pathway protein F